MTWTLPSNSTETPERRVGMAVSKRLRFEILRRDNNTCQYCGQSAPEVKLAVDHVTPKALGGSDEPSNLITACVPCNSGKTSTSPDSQLVAAVDQRAAQMAQAMEIVLRQRQDELQRDRARTDAFDKAWTAWSAGAGEIPRDPKWRASVLRFMAAGLDDAYLRDAIEIAMNSNVRARDTWKYFCGICWRELDKLKARAISIVDPRPTPPRRDDFEYMEIIEEFVGQLVVALGGTDDVKRFVSRLLWDAMPEAHLVWEDANQLPRPGYLADDEEDGTATEVAREHMASCIANGMQQIALWRQQREQHDGS